MKNSDLMVLGLAGVAVLLILKTGGVKMPATLQNYATRLGFKPSTGLSYTPTAGYGDSSKYEDYAATAMRNGGWGIE